MSKITFECTRCGTCCREMRGPMMGQIHGLMLLPEERSLFPAELIKPLFRFSPRSTYRPGLVFMYQVDILRCPHYDDKKGCKIYERRPQTCHAFPFELRGEGGVTAHSSCPEIKRLEALDIVLEVLKTYQEGAWAIRQHYNGILKHDPINIQRFDLGPHRWRDLFEGLSSEHMKFLRL